MKYLKYLKQIPLILYPYAYLIYFFFITFIWFNVIRDFLESILPEIVIIYLAFTLFIIISNIVMAAKGKYSSKEASTINLIVKGIQIPSYILHFIMGAMGLVMSVWGIGVIMFAVIMDVLTIALSGLNAISCAVSMKKEKQLPTAVCVLTAIGSFIFCIDVIIAIVWFVKCRRKKPQTAEKWRYMKYLKLIPLILYPVMNLIFLVGTKVFADDATVRYFYIIAIVYVALTLFLIISNIVMAAKGKYSAKSTSNMNLIVKCLHIITYIFYFIVGVLGLSTSIGGLAFLLVVVIADVMTIALSGLNAVSCAVSMNKEKQLPTSVCVLTAIGSFIFCIDVVIAIVWFVKCKLKEKQQVQTAAAGETFLIETAETAEMPETDEASEMVEKESEGEENAENITG